MIPYVPYGFKKTTLYVKVKVTMSNLKFMPLTQQQIKTIASLSENKIDLILSRSHAYSALHDHLKELIISQYGIDTLREVYFHELINYLRLTPYKIRKDPSMGLTFFACTSILLARYLDCK